MKFILLLVLMLNGEVRDIQAYGPFFDLKGCEIMGSKIIKGEDNLKGTCIEYTDLSE